MRTELAELLERCAARWRDASPRRADELIERARLICERARSRGPDLETSLVDVFESVLSQLDEPDLCLRVIERALDDPASEPELPGVLLLAAKLAEQGDYPARMLAQDPYLLRYLHERVGKSTPDLDELCEALRVEVSLARASDEPGSARERILDALRIFKRRESLAIYAREVSGVYSVRQTTMAIAYLAIASLRVCLEQAGVFVGSPALADKICVLGMGKLGGFELNYSSDVDLILVCADGALSDPEQRATIEQIAREMIALMEEVTARGYVFRVDMRLRPEGARGQLLQSLGPMVAYYLEWGRTWERSAMLKARPIAGDIATGEELLRQLEPFLYRRYLDFDAIEDLRAMKQLVNQNAQLSSVLGMTAREVDEQAPKAKTSSLTARLRARRRAPAPRRRRPRVKLKARASREAEGAPDPHELAERAERGGEGSASDRQMYKQEHGVLGWDVKIGVGGIREIEFFVQAIQLVHCGTRPAIRVRSTLEALDRLLYAGLISNDDHEVLSDAYDFLRRVEHRVQMEHDRQGHRLPGELEGLRRLARRLGMTIEELQATLKIHREAVTGIFSRLFHKERHAGDEPTLEQPAMLALDTVCAARGEAIFEKPVLDALERAGFRKPRQIAGQLHMLAQKTHGPYGQRASTRLRELGRYLLNACASTPDPERAFSVMTRLVTAVGDREWFWTMLAQNPHATRLLVHLFSTSEYLGGVLVRDPNIISELLGLGSAKIERSNSELREELAESLARIEDPSHRIGKIHRFHQEQMLRLALHEIGGAARIEHTTRQLGQLGELVVEAMLQEVWTNMRRSSKLVHAPHLCVDLPFCVLGMGKLGGRELGFSSDLDLIFVCEADETMRLDLDQFARLAQRFVRALSSISAQGRLYEVDTRLRPSGRQGTLVVTIEALRSYHSKLAGLWERQALLRARPLTGTQWLRREVGELRRDLAIERDVPEALAREMGQMRARMLTAASRSARVFDVKSSRGGLVDVEFSAQYLQLWCAREGLRPVSDLRALVGEELDEGIYSQNTWKALRALALRPEIQREFPDVDVEVLAQDYLMLRRLEARIRLNEQRAQTTLPEASQARLEIARRLGFQGAQALEQLEHAIDETSARVRGVTDRLLELSRG